MPKTFLWRFTFFFWFSFFLINIPIHLFGISYIKDMLKSAEHEKISLMVHTLEPVIALNISFDQSEQLYTIFDNILEYDSVHSIELHPLNGTTIHSRVHGLDITQKIFIHESSIIDPFEHNEIAKLKIRYHNTYLSYLNKQTLMIFFGMFISATGIFFIFFIFFMRKDSQALKIIADTLSSYLQTKHFEPIHVNNRSQEISTIANIVNDVAEENSHYVQELEKFNNELEKIVMQKVSKLKEQEELMIHQSRQAAMGEMLESIAHQWRQPLNIIGLSTAKLNLEYELKNLDDTSFHESMETIAYNINYMSATIDDFRNFNETNQEQVYFSPERIFEELIKILGAQLEHNNIEYKVSAQENIEVYGIENEFKQVALILVNNSMDAIKSKMEKEVDKKFTISVEISKEEHNVIIKVMDNGGGIKEEIMHSIFTAYFTTKFSSQGTGIGLHIVKNIIESRMQGLISVENIQDGCCFTITLPLKNKNEEATL